MSTFPFNIDTVTNTFPLGTSPFYSRFLENTIAEQNNYNYIAFKPGYALQASELNETLDLFYFNQTMSNLMMSNWSRQHITFNPRNSTPAEVPCHEPSTRKYPQGTAGFIGACPVDPSTVVVTPDANGAATDTPWKIKLSEGWYYVTDYSHRLGVFTYLSAAKEITLPKVNTGSLPERVGITLKYSTIRPQGEDPLLVDDGLFDNSGGVLDLNAEGASRIKVEIDNLYYGGTRVPSTIPAAINVNSCASNDLDGDGCNCFSQMFYYDNTNFYFKNGVFLKNITSSDKGATDDYSNCTDFVNWACD